MAFRPRHQLRESARRLRPAVLCLSLLLLMLGVTFVLVAALAVWLRAPEQVYLHHLTPKQTLVRGGESLATVLDYLQGEVAIALTLLITGLTGVLLSRPDRQSSSVHA